VFDALGSTRRTPLKDKLGRALHAESVVAGGATEHGVIAAAGLKV
jgi:hypothetical protein